jgi:formyl-CoA transferase/CoA:oxalate CoA-transferase
MSAPYGTVVLGDFGADVVKVESMPFGDPSRRTGTAFIEGYSAMFLQWNRSKRSLAVDLRTPDGLEIVTRLAGSADVLVENYRPGVAEEIGLGYSRLSDLNPRLIYCSVSAFGPDGPLASDPGTDPVIQAMSGVMSLTGEPDGGPLLVGVPMADFTGSMALVQAVLLGLLARERTGRGQQIDIPMLSVMLFGLTTRLASYWANGTDSVRFGSAHSVVAPYQAYSAADGDIVAGAWAPEAWPRFCEAIDRLDLVDHPLFATNPDRVAHRAQLNAILDDVFAGQTVAQWQERFHQARALFGEVTTIASALDHPQVRHLGLVRTVRHGALGDISQLAPPLVLSETPADLRLPPPLLGEHSRQILFEAGYSDDSVTDLIERGVVATPGKTLIPDRP